MCDMLVKMIIAAILLENVAIMLAMGPENGLISAYITAIGPENRSKTQGYRWA